MKKYMNTIWITILTLLMISMIPCSDVEAASKVNNLVAGKTYKYDLDQDGKKEQIRFVLTESGKYNIYINGKVKKTITFDEWYYNPQMQIMDIDKNDGFLDIWVYCYCDSEDIRYSALYRYKNKKISRVWNLTYGDDYEAAFYRMPGYISSTDGKGNFTVVMDRAVKVGFVVGNHLDRVKYQIKNNKVTRVSKKEFYFEKTYAVNDDRNDESLVCAKEITFYKKRKDTNSSFTVKKGKKVYPVKVYIESRNRQYVQFKTESGMKGWLCTSDFSWYNQPFTNMSFFD